MYGPVRGEECWSTRTNKEIKDMLYGDDKLDVHGSVYHSITYLEITNKMRPHIRIYYSNVSYCSTCFERHIARHQELKNSICSLWFTYVCGCRPLSTAGNHRRM
jgi:hypothetical protein